MPDSDLGWFLRRAARYAPWSAQVFALVLLSLLLTFLEPLFVMVFTNEAVRKTNLNLLVALATCMVCVSAAAQYLGGVARAQRSRLGQAMAADLRREVFGRCLRQSPRFFEQNPPGSLLALTTAEVDALDALHHALFFVPATAVALLALLACCFFLDPTLFLLLFVPMPAWFLFRAVQGRADAHGEAALGHQASLVRFVKHHLANVPTVQAFGREPGDERRLSAISDAMGHERAASDALRQFNFRLTDFLRTLILALILLVGGMKLIRGGEGSLGALLAVFAFAGLAFQESQRIFIVIADAAAAIGPLARLRRLATVEPEVADPAAAQALDRAQGTVEFERVWFRYSPDQAWALADVSFCARPGETVAVVGLSGSGKSTLFQMLLRFHQPERGSVRLDGADVREIRIGDLRRQFGLASQHPVLFDGTVLENVAYGREGASEAEVVEAVRRAEAWDFVRELPEGLETRLAEDACALSGGQRQRISLARVLLKGAPVLLLDEASAALDAKTEAAVEATLRRLAPEHTTIVIAHRLSTVLRADRILVMEDGRIAQQGTHEQLYRQGGIYRFLFDHQFAEVLERVHRSEAA